MLPVYLSAQVDHLTDPFDNIFERVADDNPDFRIDFERHQKEIAAKADKYMAHIGGANKTTGTKKIPVVFHIILDSTKMKQMGGREGIITRIQSQMDVLNEDYNAANEDSTGIPEAFKSFYANLNIEFALAHTDPNGRYTPGYEFVTTQKKAFDADNGTRGTRYNCSDAKFSISGGADAWDPKKYLNIWVINITPNGVGGIGTPPPYPLYGGTQYFPWAEQGIVLLYSVLGRRTAANQYFYSTSTAKGRSLVHEIGHFFNLFHLFGISTLQNSNCQDDDGVEDTPPQEKPTQIRPVFPLVDICTPDSPGVMYMNHMDYAQDPLRIMFSKGQKARVYVELEQGGYRYSLLQHPEVFENGTTDIEDDLSYDKDISLFPNPAYDVVSLSFSSNRSLLSISIINQMGQLMEAFVPEGNTNDLRIDVSAYASGFYYVQCRFKEGIAVKKMLVK